MQKNRREVEKKNEELKQLREETAGRNLAEIEEQLAGVKGQMKKLDTKIYGLVHLANYWNTLKYWRMMALAS